tara:strand:+ start:217 stop:1476 length:1260 start_codon:yes stop_codon:yes gene_type:complete
MILFYQTQLMSNSVQLPNEQFDFSSLSLANPQGLQGGAYFSKLKLNGQPFLVQTPKCSTKNGIHKTEKKIYCDMMFTNDDEEFIKWTNQLESTIKNLIFEKRNLWFHNDMDHDSIDYHWQNLLRTYKGNKLLLRCFIPKSKSRIGSKTVQIYNEEEEELTFDDIDKTSRMISILEVSGLKFTSQSFQLEFMLRQIMVIKEKPLFNKCLIKISNPPTNVTPTKPELESDSESDISVDDSTLQVEAKVEEKNEETDFSNNQLESNLPTENIIQDISSSDIPSSKDDIIDNLVNETIDLSNNSQINIEDIQELPVNKIDSTENLEETEPIEQDTSNTEESLEKNGIINEIEILPPSESTDSVTLKKPNEVYMEIYKEAKKKAQEAKKHAIQAYLEAKRIKSLYLLDEIESSDDELDFEAYAN